MQPNLSYVGMRIPSESNLMTVFAIPDSFTPQDPANGQIDISLFPVIASYQAADRKIRVSFFAGKIAEEIGVGDLAELDSRARNHRLVGRREEVNNGQIAHLITEFRLGDESWLCRSKCIKDGNNFFRLEASALASCADDDASVCANIALSLTLQPKATGLLAEEMRTVMIADGRLQFKIPASWQVGEPFSLNEQTVCVELIRHATPLDEKICVELIEQRSPDVIELMKEYTLRLQDGGLHVSGSAVVAIDVPFDFDKGYLCSPSINMHGEELAGGCAVFLKDLQAVRISCLGARRGDLPMWAITKRAYELILETLRVSL